jgi:hypothetical protein
METLMIAATVAVLGGLMLVAGLEVYRLWHVGMREEQTLLMNRVLEHEGVRLDGGTEASVLTQTAHAARSCLLCRGKETCIAWLEGEATVPLDHFCRNADLIARLRADGRTSAPSVG